jgi:hypothetical protein
MVKQVLQEGLLRQYHKNKAVEYWIFYKFHGPHNGRSICHQGAEG